MKLRLIKTALAKELYANIEDNLKKYRNGNFDSLSIDPTNYFEIEVEIEENLLSSIGCSNDPQKDILNCLILFKAMDSLSLNLARDERVWIYLTHSNLLDYTRKRWPIADDDEQAIKNIQNHFFVKGERGFERDNSVSRLWWMANLCNRVDGLSLEQALTCLLYRTDVRANVIERPTTSQNANIFSAILKILHLSYKGKQELFERDTFRKAMVKLNLIGGTKLLDSLDIKGLNNVLDECF